MSIMTLKAGIEEAIKKAVPEITGVEAATISYPEFFDTLESLLQR